MKYKTFTLCILAFLCLVGCKKESDAPVDSELVETKPGTVTNLPVDVSPAPSESVVTPTPMSEEEAKQNFSQAMVSTLKGSVVVVYECEEHPVYYPVDETNMTRLRDDLTRWNDTYPEIRWDPYSIEACTWGFRATALTPVDGLGQSQYVWFEVMPDDTSKPRLIVASAGEDGVLTFNGTGLDYSNGGFGDDDVRFITF